MTEESSGDESVQTTPQTQNTELVDQVFSLFKVYLSSQLDALQGKQLQSKLKIDNEAAELKFKGNSKQFEVNAQVEGILDNIKNSTNKAHRVLELDAQAKQAVKKRQKLIKIADKNKDGWLDEKRLKKAKSAAEMKIKTPKAKSNKPKGLKLKAVFQ